LLTSPGVTFQDRTTFECGEAWAPPQEIQKGLQPGAEQDGLRIPACFGLK